MSTNTTSSILLHFRYYLTKPQYDKITNSLLHRTRATRWSAGARVSSHYQTPSIVHISISPLSHSRPGLTQALSHHLLRCCFGCKLHVELDHLCKSDLVENCMEGALPKTFSFPRKSRLLVMEYCLNEIFNLTYKRVHFR